MTFFKLCKYDLKSGMRRESVKYLVCAILFLGFCVGFIYTKGKGLEARTFGDFLFFITAGMEEYIPMPGNIFMVPALWVLMILAPLYITLYYPFYDLTAYGKNVLINAKSRLAWWLSKCFWAISCVFIYYLLLWGVIALFCVCGGKLSLDISKSLIFRLIPMPSEDFCFTEGDFTGREFCVSNSFYAYFDCFGAFCYADDNIFDYKTVFQLLYQCRHTCAVRILSKPVFTRQLCDVAEKRFID